MKSLKLTLVKNLSHILPLFKKAYFTSIKGFLLVQKVTFYLLSRYKLSTIQYYVVKSGKNSINFTHYYRYGRISRRI
jgi:uncharacterized membrane protein YjdF